MLARAALPLVLLVALLAGCGRGNDGPLRCADGFRADDWEERRLETGTAVARCGWFTGKPGTDVGPRLGAADQVAGRYYRWDLGEEPGDAAGRHRFLRLKYDPRTRTITEARTLRDVGRYRPERRLGLLVATLAFALVTAGLMLWLAASGWRGPAGLAAFAFGVVGVLVSLAYIALTGAAVTVVLVLSLVNLVTGGQTLLRTRRSPAA